MLDVDNIAANVALLFKVQGSRVVCFDFARHKGRGGGVELEGCDVMCSCAQKFPVVYFISPKRRLNLFISLYIQNLAFDSR